MAKGWIWGRGQSIENMSGKISVLYLCHPLENKFYRPIYGEDCSWPWSTGFQIGQNIYLLTNMI